MSTKDANWSNEQEWRLVVIPKPDVVPKPLVRLSASGQEIPYFSVPLRAGGLLISLEEITIGPRQDAEEGRQRAVEILRRCGYTESMPEWPRIVTSDEGAAS